MTKAQILASRFTGRNNVLPIVGTVAYFTLRKPTDREIRAHQAAAAERRRR